MRKVLPVLLIILVIAGVLYLFSKCLEGVDTKKTGLSKSSASIQESRRNDVFHFQLIPSQPEVSLPGGKKLRIESAWIEDGWSYEARSLCRIYVQKKDYKQLVIQVKNYSFDDYQTYLPGDSLQHYFSLLYNASDSSATLIGAVSGLSNEFRLFFYKDHQMMRRVDFHR